MGAAVVVETRVLPSIRDTINNHFRYLNKDWQLFVYHGPDNGHLFLEFKAKLIKLDNNINKSGYNNLLASTHFWEQIPHDKILIFQHDSLLLRHGIEEFMEWDYIGAPIHNTKVQNGGLSLRSRKVMLDICKNHKINGQNEDNFFCYNIDKYGKLAPLEVAKKFSCEMTFSLGTLGCHALDRYMNTNQRKVIKEQYANPQPYYDFLLQFNNFKAHKHNSDQEKAFNEEKYLFDYVDVREAVKNGTFKSGYEHYRRFGFAEQRQAYVYSLEEIHLFDDPGDFKKFFNEEEYLNDHPDVKTAVQRGEFESGFQHYRKFGWFEERIK